MNATSPTGRLGDDPSGETATVDDSWPAGGPSLRMTGGIDGRDRYTVTVNGKELGPFSRREAAALFRDEARQLAETLPVETWQRDVCRAWLLSRAADMEFWLRRVELGIQIRSAWDDVAKQRQVSALADALGVHRDTLYAVRDEEAWV
jgi:hypothetical protein